MSQTDDTPSFSRAAAVALAVALLAFPQVAAAKPKPVDPARWTSAGAGVVPGEVIVGFEAGADSARRADLRREVGARFKREMLVPGAELVAVQRGSERAAAAALARRADVAYAEPNAIVHGQATPSDTRFGELWGLHNRGQTVNAVAGAADADIDASEAWSIGKGLGATVRVAVVDSGVAANHPDLAANMFRNPGESGGGRETNGVDDDANGFVDDFRGWDFINDDNDPADDHSHGSHVAGTIAARSNNALGASGVASFPTASGNWAGPKILAVKVLGITNSGPLSAIADGLAYAGRMGARVANVSLGGPGAEAV